MLNSPSHAKRAAADNLEPVSKSPRQNSSTLPLVEEESDEDTRLDREMTIEEAKLGPHTSPNDDILMLDDPIELRSAMEEVHQRPNENPPPPPTNPNGGRVSPSTMTEATADNPQKPRGYGGPEGPEEAMQEEEMDDLHPYPPPPPPKEGGEVDADEVTAKLIFYYPFETESCDRHAFNEGALLSELNAQAAMIGNDFPLFTKGVVRVPKGQPASVLLPSEELADRFIEHTETLVVDAKSRDGKECLATLKVEKRLIHLAEKLALAPPRPDPPACRGGRGRQA